MRRLLLNSAAAVAMMSAVPALAQGETAAEDSALTDIVVTAQKRTERLQDVPLAVTVVSGEALAASGAVNIEGAQYLVPSLNFRKSGTAINQSLFLRGVGTSTFSIAGEPSISTVVDGVVYSRAGEAFSDLIDIERMEVLRGPQGTLFGKNTSAGVVNIVTKRPGDELGGYVEAGFFGGNGNEYRVRGALDLPLGEHTAARISGFYGEYDGNLYNEYAKRRVNGYKHYGVRGIVVSEPSESLTLTLIGDWRKSKDDCCAELIGTVPSNVAAQILPKPEGNRTRNINQNLITRTEETSWGLSLQADLELGSQLVTYIGSYREYDNTEIRDGDWLDQPYVGLAQLHDVGPQTSNTFTQELRLTSPADQFISYVVGAYYSRAETERTFTRDIIGCVGTASASPVPCSTTGTVGYSGHGTANYGSIFQNMALFGQGTVNFSDRFRGIVGLRYTADQLNVFLDRVATGVGINPSFSFRDKTTNENLSGKAGLQFDVVPESTAYATYARGYKGPAFNVFFNLTATGTNVIEPETADSFEVGLKNTLMNGALVLNVAAFYAKYQNFQANNPDQIVIAGVPSVITRFTNAGDVSTRGVELDFVFRPLDDLNLSGGVAYTDARVDQFKVPPGGTAKDVVPPGTPLAYAPKWKGTLTADYRIRTEGPVDILLGAQGSYQSRQISQPDASPVNRAATVIDGYGLLDLSLGVSDREDRYRLTFQVKNVFDTSFAAAIVSGGPGGSFRYIIPREADRYFGVTGRINF